MGSGNRRISTSLAVAALVVLVIGIGAAAFFYDHNATENMVTITERNNVVLARTIANTVILELSPGVAHAQDGALVTDPTATEITHIDAILRQVTDGLPILKMKMYNPEGRTIYSSDFKQIGESSRTNDGFIAAKQERRPSSKVTSRDTFSAYSGEVFNVDIVETYTPIVSQDGRLEGVFEVYYDVTALRQAIDRTKIGIAGISGAIFLAIYGALGFALRHALRPVHDASRLAARIGPKHPTSRLPTNRVPAEILPLVDAVNDALGRLSQALEAEREFAADAAHELLTPLAVLRANIDTLDDKEIAADLRADVDVMSEVVRELLELVEIDVTSGAPVEPVDLQGVVEDVAGHLQRAAAQRKIKVVIAGDRPVMVSAASRAVSRAVRNLVDNAISFAPEGTDVVVTTFADGTVSVRDHGPGVKPEHRHLVFRRFWRAATDRNRPGAGLGLSMVQRVAEVYGGTARVDTAPGGGALFTLKLPLATEV